MPSIPLHALRHVVKQRSITSTPLILDSELCFVPQCLSLLCAAGTLVKWVFRQWAAAHRAVARARGSFHAEQ